MIRKLDDRKVKRKLVAIFSADVKGYSRLMADNEIETVTAIKACRKLIFQKIFNPLPVAASKGHPPGP